MKKWIFIGILLIPAVVLGIYLVINIREGSEITDLLVKRGWFPRITAWALLLIGAYGLGRSRFSFLLTAVFFLLAFSLPTLGHIYRYLKTTIREKRHGKEGTIVVRGGGEDSKARVYRRFRQD